MMTDSIETNTNDGAEASAPKMLLKFDVHKTRKRGRKKLVQGTAPEQEDTKFEGGRTPSISKFMALAIHLQNFVDQGKVRDYAEIARLTGLTRARVTQIMNLNLLAPEIQEEILFLPKTLHGKDLIVERNVRNITKNIDWIKQKRKWNTITAECNL